MGLRGPKPTPTAFKKLMGTFRPGRASNNEAQPIGKPHCPCWLNPDATKEFRRLCKLLTTMGLIGQADENALARYASTWCRWRQAMQVLEKSGEVTIYRDKEGKATAVQPSAYHAIARGLAEQLDKIENSFGMTPSARSRINVQMPTAAPEAAPKSRFFDEAPMKIAQ